MKLKWRLLEKEKPEDGKWIIAISKDRRVQLCRYKWDAEDHYFPSCDCDLSVEETVAWVYASEWFDSLERLQELYSDDFCSRGEKK